MAHDLDWQALAIPGRELTNALHAHAREGWTLRAIAHPGTPAGFLAPPAAGASVVLVLARPRALANVGPDANEPAA